MVYYRIINRIRYAYRSERHDGRVISIYIGRADGRGRYERTTPARATPTLAGAGKREGGVAGKGEKKPSNEEENLTLQAQRRDKVTLHSLQNIQALA